MAGETPVTILHIVGPIASSCAPTQFGVEIDVDPVTGFRMWGGKDSLGNVTKWLALDKYARVTTLRAETTVSTPYIDLDDLAGSTPSARRVFWDRDEDAPAYYSETDNIKTILPRTQMAPLVLNNTGSTILRGTPCLVRAAVGTRPTIVPASSTGYVNGDVVVFPVRDVANGATADALWVGMLENVDTSAFAANDKLYLSGTEGALTNTAPATEVYVGRCVVVSATVGRILCVGCGFGNVYVPAVASVTVNKTLTKTGTVTAPALAVSPSIALVSGDNYAETDGAIPGSTGSISRGIKAATLLYTGDLLSANSGYFASNSLYIAYSDNTNVVYVHDRATGKRVFSGSLVIARIEFCGRHELCALTTTGYYRIDLQNRTISSKFSVTVGSSVSETCTGSDGKIYYADGYVIKTLDPSTGTVATVSTITGMAGSVSSIAADVTGDKIVVLDVNSTSYYLRIYTLSSGGAPVSSTAVKTTTLVSSTHDIYINANTIYAAIRVSGTQSRIEAYSYSDLSVTPYVGGSIAASNGTFFDRSFFARNGSNALVAYKLPGLTHRVDADLDARNGTSVFKSNNVIKTSTDFIDACLLTDSLSSIAFGGQVLSSATSLPGSPVVGGWYLLNYGQQTVSQYTVNGWVHYSPYEGATVYDVATSLDYRYKSGSWVAMPNNIELSLYGATTDGSSSGDTTILTLDGTNYPVLSEGEAWDVSVEVFGYIDPADAAPYTAEPVYGKWVADVVLSRGIASISDSENTVNGINSGGGTVFNTPVVKPTWMDKPTITVSSTGLGGAGTGDIEIAVGHTNALGFTVHWTARIVGQTRMIRPKRYYS